MTQKSAKWFPVISILIGIGIGLILAEIILSQLKTQISASSQLDDGLFRYHHQLGWVMTPLWHGRQKHLDYDVSYQIDRDGFRYTPQQKNKTDILILGDSFTFGVGVEDAETFVNQLNRESVHGWKNLAVAGYSTDQEWLLLQKTALENVKTVMLVVYLGNDLVDNLLDSPIQANFLKPYFKLINHQLILKNQPVPPKQKKASDKPSLKQVVFKPETPHFYDQLALTQWLKATSLFKADFSPAQLTDQFIGGLTLFEQILTQMQQYTTQNKVELKIVLLAGASALNRQNSKSAQLQQWLAAQIMQITKKLQLPTLNLLKAFQAQKTDLIYFPNEGHLSAKGHFMVANIIKKWHLSKND